MKTPDLQTVRRFNRTLTQRIGALDQNFLGMGRPLGEARLIYEIGTAGQDVRSLRTKLGLDAGYATRLVRSLERQRLVVREAHAADARRRTVKLSRKGLSELRAYDRKSDAFAASLLRPLDGAQRSELLAAMSTVNRLLYSSQVEIVAESADSLDARRCLDAYYRELATRFELGFDPGKSISATPRELTAPHGCFLVARAFGRAVGCGALKVKSHGIGEIKRMWVDSAARGLGVGARILGELERRAVELGLRTLRLETNRSLKEAQALYKRSGYAKVKPFNDEPYAHHWFEKALPSRMAGARRVPASARAIRVGRTRNARATASTRAGSAPIPGSRPGSSASARSIRTSRARSR
jgi:DNA-binding MarR family transcriptional regulator/GNAT superfamily N-acetyltransferase